MAHTKAQGSVKGNRDSVSKRLGIKIYGGQRVGNGGIIIRQRGSTFFPGSGVSMGRDFTLFAVRSGIVAFKQRQGKQIVEVLNG